MLKNLLARRQDGQKGPKYAYTFLIVEEEWKYLCF